MGKNVGRVLKEGGSVQGNRKFWQIVAAEARKNRLSAERRSNGMKSKGEVRKAMEGYRIEIRSAKTTDGRRTYLQELLRLAESRLNGS